MKRRSFIASFLAVLAAPFAKASPKIQARKKVIHFPGGTMTIVGDCSFKERKVCVIANGEPVELSLQEAIRMRSREIYSETQLRAASAAASKMGFLA